MRVARAGVFAASSVALAVGAHRLGGGMPPTRAAVVAASVVLFAFGVVWTRRERRGPAITAVVLAGQLALHAGFGYASAAAMSGSRASAEVHMAGPDTGGGAGMLAMHLAAAGVMAWWLRRGERAAWTTARRIGRVIVAAARPAPAPVTSVAAPRAVGLVWAPRQRTWGAGLAGRGPPALAVSVLTA